MQTRNDAIKQGFTVNVIGDSHNGEYTMDLQVKPDTDLTGVFTAWCNLEDELLEVHGNQFDLIAL